MRCKATVRRSLLPSVSRATAGHYKGPLVISSPGSEGAVNLRMEKLILPEVGHLVQQLSK